MTEIEHFDATLNRVRMHYVAAGHGEPVVLLHGWPQTSYAWRKVMPLLADRYRLIAPDMPGLGDSSAPEGGYDKKTIAGDIWELMHNHLGLNRFYLVGHDWGGPVAYRVAATHPDAVRALAILDVVIPGDGGDGFSQKGRRWHHAFHMAEEIPETLIEGREREYLTWFWRYYTSLPGAVTEADMDEYMRTYGRPESMKAWLGYYRALPQDIEDNLATAQSQKLKMPVLALGGDGTWARKTEPLESLRRVAKNVTGGVVANSGHNIPEEQPKAVAEQLTALFENAA